MRVILCFFFVFVSVVSAQQTAIADFKSAQANLVIDANTASVSGNITYVLEVLQATDSIYLDAVNMQLSNVLLNGKSCSFSDDLKKFWFMSKFKKGKTYTLSFSYTSSPKKALYFVNRMGANQIWTQGQGKYTSHWLPSIDDMNDKIEFDLTITHDSRYQVIANGALVKKHKKDSVTTWSYDMQQPMASYLVALAIGQYVKKQEVSKSGIPIALYHYPEDSIKVDPTYRYSKQMFDFLEEEIGVSYPWQNYKQVPVHDFLYAGMENTGCTIFTDDLMIDTTSFVDKNYVNVNAHELAHQWFGNLVTEVSGTHHWLHEGFATYYALLAERAVFGDDYYYWQLYKYAQDLIQQDKDGKTTSLLNPKSSSITFYQKGAWVLHALRYKIGDKAFKAAVASYLDANKYVNVDTNDFISQAENISGQDLNDFVNEWIISDNLPSLFKSGGNKDGLGGGSQALVSFLGGKNGVVNAVEALKASLKKGYDFEVITALFDAFALQEETNGIGVSEKVIIAYLKHLHLFSVDEMQVLLQKALRFSNIKVRQFIASDLKDISVSLKTNFETLLHDKSYLTVQYALFNLWFNFPQQRKNYLETTKAIYGFNNYNVRQLWLALAIATPDYNKGEVTGYVNELADYAQEGQPFSRRQVAFTYLEDLNLFDKRSIKSLMQATNHHNWRFKLFAKQVFEDLSKKEEYKTVIYKLQQLKN